MDPTIPLIGAGIGAYDSIRKRNQLLENKKKAAAIAMAGGQVDPAIMYGQEPSFLLDTAQGGLAGAGQAQAFDKFSRDQQSQDLWDENLRARTGAYQSLAQKQNELSPEELRQFQMWRSLQKVTG